MSKEHILAAGQDAPETLDGIGKEAQEKLAQRAFLLSLVRKVAGLSPERVLEMRDALAQGVHLVGENMEHASETAA